MATFLDVVIYDLLKLLFSKTSHLKNNTLAPPDL